MSRRIQIASKVPEEAVLVNKSLVREGYFDPADMERVLKHKVRLLSHPIMRPSIDAMSAYNPP